MAAALQCPACGCKHRLSELAGDAIFSCDQCGRLLKTPPEYRRPELSGPASPPPPRARVERGGAAASDRTAVFTTGVAGTAAAVAAEQRAGGERPPRSRPARRARSAATADLPLRILAWIVAFLIGAYLVRYVARATGILTGDTVIDFLTGSGGWFRFVRLAFIVPVWALFTAGLATLFIEGGRLAIRRREAVRRVTARRTPPPAASRPVPRTPPEVRSPQAAAGGQRARRIPRRDVTS